MSLASTTTVAVAVLVTIAPGASAHPAPEPSFPVVNAPYAEQVASLHGRSQAEYLSPSGEYDYVYLRHRVTGFY
jgi:hypothetical protein